MRTPRSWLQSKTNNALAYAENRVSNATSFTASRVESIMNESTAIRSQVSDEEWALRIDHRLSSRNKRIRELLSVTVSNSDSLCCGLRLAQILDAVTRHGVGCNQKRIMRSHMLKTEFRMQLNWLPAVWLRTGTSRTQGCRFLPSVHTRVRRDALPGGRCRLPGHRCPRECGHSPNRDFDNETG